MVIKFEAAAGGDDKKDKKDKDKRKDSNQADGDWLRMLC